MKRQLILGLSIVLAASLGGCGPTTEEKVQKLFQSANGWSATGEYDLAIKDYSEAIRLKPKHYDAWNNRGTAFKQLAIEARSRDDFLEAKEFEARARADLLKAKALKPGD